MSSSSRVRRARAAAAAALAAFLAAPAAAHITLEYEAASAGSYYKATLRVMHGCAGSPTRQLVVDIPSGVRGARPMPRAGWAIDIVRSPVPQPAAQGAATDEVSRITWTARTREDQLANAHYDEFVVMARMPEQPGPLYWKIGQVCEQGRVDWAEVPAAGQDARELKQPAAVLQVIPAVAGGHQH